MSKPSRRIRAGIYTHAKPVNGRLRHYLVVTARAATSDCQRVVVYLRLYPDNGPRVWVRPYDEFASSYPHSYAEIPRFRRVSWLRLPKLLLAP